MRLRSKSYRVRLGLGIVWPLLGCGALGAVQAEAVKPARCASRQPYAGRPLRAAVSVAPGTFVESERTLAPELVTRLDEAFTVATQAAQATAISAAVAPSGGGLWRASRTPPASPLLYWASAGKTFTAVIVMQLAEEGRLSLDSPVRQWVRDVPYGELVTLRDLLAHTSGLFSANEDVQARRQPRYRAPAETLAIARRHGALFCPGADWRYSNTGYDVLGEVIRAVDGRPFEAAIEARIVAPLGLRSLRALTPGAGAPDVAPLVSVRQQPIDPSWPGAAGPIAADAADMLRFWAALLDGRLVSAASLSALFERLYPMFDPGTYYGLGTMVFEVDDAGHHNLWLGHAGGTPGGSAMVLYSPADAALVAVALTGDGPATAVANTLLKALRPAAPRH